MAQSGGNTKRVALEILDPGPIPHAVLRRYDDPDIETGLEHCGYSADGAVYRMIEVDLSDLEDVRHFPFKWQPTKAVERLRSGEDVPPIIVVQTDRGLGLGIIDGLNRTYAHWIVGLPRIVAYELLVTTAS